MKLRIIWLVLVLAFLCSIAAAEGTVEAKIGETKYQTLQDAINAAETGSIIVLQKDVSPASLTITGKNITISGNWKNITSSGTTEISEGAKVVFDRVSILTGTVSVSGTSSVEMKDSSISAQVLVYNSTLKTSETSYTNVSGTVIVAENGSSLTIDDCTFRANTGTNGGALYLKGSTATLNGNTISGNRAKVGGGIYVDEGAVLIVNSGEIFDNTADMSAADVFVAENASRVSLPSVTAWNRPIQRESRFSLDGWYEDAAGNRWSSTNAHQGSGNIYVGDTVLATVGHSHSLKAGFTAYDVLNVEIEWVDYNNRYGTRMETVDITVRDKAGKLLKYQTLDGSEGETASLTLSEANGWKGTISPLSPGLSASLHIDDITFDLTSGGNVIRTYDIDGNKPYVKVDRWRDEPVETSQGPSAVSTVHLKNTYKIPVKFAKVWDDSNNKDGVRPQVLKVYLKYNNEDLTPFEDINLSGIVHPPIYMTAEDDWKRTVYLLADDEKDYYANIGYTEDCPNSYVNTQNSATPNSDGSIDITFINHHDLRVDPDVPDPVSVDKINYRIDIEWSWNGNGSGELPHPKITVLLRGDGKEVGRAEIAADAEQYITFSDLPKYRDNEKSALVDYTIQETITDENWVRFPVTEAGDGGRTTIVDYWYSLDGMGRYRVEYTQAEIKDDTAPLSIVTGKITNKYERLQDTTKIIITKFWKDHQNENEVRPGSIMFGLFRNADDAIPASTSTLSGGSTDGTWRGTMENLPTYDDSGKVINYSVYIVKESYDNGTTWLKSGNDYSITVGEKTYTYNYSVVMQR